LARVSVLCKYNDTGSPSRWIRSRQIGYQVHSGTVVRSVGILGYPKTQNPKRWVWKMAPGRSSQRVQWRT